MFEGLYENHFLRLRCSRATFLAFVRYTADALTKSNNPALQALAAELTAELVRLGESVVARQGQAGTTQGQTRTRRELLALMRQFVRDLNAELLVPKYRQRPAELDVLLPGGLTAFGAGTDAEVPVLFAAFARELEARQAELGADPGARARQLLAELGRATELKNTGQKQVRETISAIGEGWAGACRGLWRAHCRALAEFADEPARARAFFNYALLPSRTGGKRQKPTDAATPQ